MAAQEVAKLPTQKRLQERKSSALREGQQGQQALRDQANS